MNCLLFYKVRMFTDSSQLCHRRRRSARRCTFTAPAPLRTTAPPSSSPSALPQAVMPPAPSSTSCRTHTCSRKTPSLSSSPSTAPSACVPPHLQPFLVTIKTLVERASCCCANNLMLNKLVLNADLPAGRGACDGHQPQRHQRHQLLLCRRPGVRHLRQGRSEHRDEQQCGAARRRLWCGRRLQPLLVVRRLMLNHVYSWRFPCISFTW